MVHNFPNFYSGFSSIYQNINIPSYPNNIPQQEIKLPPKKDISSTDISSISYYHKFLQYINYRIFRMNIINHQQQTNTDKLILFQLPLSLLTTNINNHNKPIIIRINIPNSCTTVENFQNLIYTKLKDNDLLTDNDKEKPILIKYFSNKSKSKFLVTIDNNTKDNSTTMIPKNELSWIITNDDDIKAIPSGAIIQLLIKEE